MEPSTFEWCFFWEPFFEIISYSFANIWFSLDPFVLTWFGLPFFQKFNERLSTVQVMWGVWSLHRGDQSSLQDASHPAGRSDRATQWGRHSGHWCRRFGCADFDTFLEVPCLWTACSPLPLFFDVSIHPHILGVVVILITGWFQTCSCGEANFGPFSPLKLSMETWN